MVSSAGMGIQNVEGWLFDEMEDAVAVIDGSRFQRLAFILVHVLQAIAEGSVAGEGADMAVAETEVAVGAVGDAVAAVAVGVAALRGAGMVDVGELGGAAAADIGGAVGVAAGDQRRGGLHRTGDQIRAVVLGVAVVDMADQMGRDGEVVGDAAVGGVGVGPSGRRRTAWADAFGGRGGGHVVVGLHEVHPLGGLVFDEAEHVVVVLLVHAHAEGDLLQVVDAADGTGLLAGFREGGQQHGGENGDDGDDHQQLDEGEMTRFFHEDSC